ncbi:cytochrome o ubiquinol oxidase subunit III [Allofranklinella schreckenbergeri]|uniref:Cytochrome bo(3) ubiquinol oxidase subunit 3 n=1 Tax=Allofranklinella schreckenbergeri TaxID=1076744 RepID=A0A3M6PYS9_9BURK|nr:cytochrome o ubiquinol oxidase subunit III [Allofranklinella schreckenbergeri]MDO4704599.1 cytochrome o ubiquinol oxidase subunit III [Comamonadaceae bacterium]RRD41536.1 cytochrome o ubiquinol oxidase subunit III [Comamonadaceae bacterium OH3737_COT-264]RMW96192.1 cytochrome o ubiquinol oxidase subunit III [Allofranklinella schreckenbergeri]RMW97922.1 cytochrome o ubiquinol oxidase subunit III [Allofranklinella schreckenbergeri]RMX06280.1 cytochrome o ubiquinol oxidase subunit III [Allofra
MTVTATVPKGERVYYLVEDPHAGGHDHGYSHGHNNTTGLGFWIYLMTDCLIFAILFAMYAILGRSYAAGPSPADLFELPLILVNTFMLLFSSITFGFAMLQSYKGNVQGTIKWLLITAAFGLAFLAIEIYEFYHLIHVGAGPHRSAFLSSFFTLVGTHGLHVTFGIIWLLTLVFQLRKSGLIEANNRRLMCLSMFWHFLDLIWICVFSFVYLMGVLE